MKINIFTPPRFNKRALDVDTLNKITNVKWQYTSNGRASFFHILSVLNIDKILIPAYVCETVLIPLKKLNITPIYYDLEKEDLNASLESIKYLSQKHEVSTILVASMYGNPANLINIEKYCLENNIFLIDDAAQSFGAKLDDRYIGTFGDAGFFSFSPGKPTAAHMGSFFWSKKKININRTKHFLTHYFRWLDIDINRNNIYVRYNKIYKKIVNLVSRILLKFINIDNDNISKFEEIILGGVLSDNLNGKFSFRQVYQKEFVNKFLNNKYFKVIENTRGIANNHKFVILFEDIEVAQKFIKYMFNHSIYVLNGYPTLSYDLEDLVNIQSINGKVVELPIEDDREKMDYLFKKVEKFES